MKVLDCIIDLLEERVVSGTLIPNQPFKVQGLHLQLEECWPLCTD